MIVVADASVALKWFFRTRADEADVGAALKLLAGVADGSVVLLEPPHFIAEVAAVLAREAPLTATSDLRDLLALNIRIEVEPSVYERAVVLATRHKHHLFDTLYHALALATPGATLVTADEAYRRRAHGEGAIMRLADFE